MKNTTKNELGGVGTGYRVLDVRCVCVEDDAANDVHPGRTTTVPSSAKIGLPALRPIVLARERFTPRSRSAPIRYSEATSTQIAAARRKRSMRLGKIVREERIPLLCALTGIATSTLLAMLFSMLEPRAVSLGVRNGGSAAVEREYGDGYEYGAQGTAQEGRGTATPTVPSEVVAAILAVKPWIVPFPAVLGLAILMASWLGRIVRAVRSPRFSATDSASDRNVGENQASRCSEPAISPTKKQTEAHRAESPSVASEQEPWRRAA